MHIYLYNNLFDMIQKSFRIKLIYFYAGITPLNEERHPPNYIPRVFSSPTQYGSIYTDSR